MKIKKLLLISVLFLSGCQRPEMEKVFPDGRARIMTDEDGRRYVVSWHMGNVYTVRPIDTVFVNPQALK